MWSSLFSKTKIKSTCWSCPWGKKIIQMWSLWVWLLFKMYHEYIDRVYAGKKPHSNVKTVTAAFPQGKIWIDIATVHEEKKSFKCDHKLARKKVPQRNTLNQFMRKKANLMWNFRILNVLSRVAWIRITRQFMKKTSILNVDRL